MEYLVKKTDNDVIIDAIWDKNFWADTEEIVLENYMGEFPEHFPETKVKIKYNNKEVIIIFKVVEKNVKAVAEKNNDAVFQDSCVEFFFNPNANKTGYFNLETNCGGVVLFGVRSNKGEKSVKFSDSEIEELGIKSTLPKNIKNEIKEETEWIIEYKIPFELLKKYMEFKLPITGDIWFCNFYKCADNSSTPHWLTWNKVEFEAPNFHMPEYFGKIIFA